MLSYTALRTKFGELSQDASSDNLTFGDNLINQSIKTVLAKNGGKWPFLEVVKTGTTTASTDTYDIPMPIRKLMSLYVTVGTTKYLGRAVEDWDTWQKIIQANLGSTDSLQFFYVLNNQVILAPTPSTSSNTLYFRGRKHVPDLANADYTTGTITSIANAATTVTGSGTTWTSKMIGRYLTIPIAQGGDGLWYEIASVTDTTHLELSRAFQGTSVAAATATYTIGEMPVLPEDYHEMPLFRALAIYWDMQRDVKQSERYWRLYDGGYEAGLRTEIGGMLGDMLAMYTENVEGNFTDRFLDVQIRNPNFPPPTVTI